MANSTAQIEKDKRGFKSPMIDTPPEVIGQLYEDISAARKRLYELLNIQNEVCNSLWSDLKGPYKP